MTTTYPASKMTFSDPAGTSTLASPDHAVLHTNINDTVEAIQDTIGTTGGTSIFKNFVAGDFPVRINAGGTLQQVFNGTANIMAGTIAPSLIGTLNNTVLGTPSITGGTANSMTFGTPVVRAWDGWNDANETWTYASAQTITVPSGAASKYSVGDKIKWTQTTVKYGVIIAVADTLLTIATNTDYTVANAAITENYYSHQTSPIGYPGWFSYSPTFTGFSANPTVGYAKFNVAGKTCDVVVALTANGTSNATSFTVTMPINNNAGNIADAGVSTAIDNGTEQAAAPAGRITSGTTTCTIYKTHDTASTWTNSGGKRFVSLRAFYPI